jgi:AmmeMemoRadiSam system protein A
MEITTEQGQILLEHARRTIALKLGRAEHRQEIESPDVFRQKGATFVTLKKRGQLRGCIGNLEPVGSIWDGIHDNALNAAFHDLRFSPLKPEEFDEIHIDISLLSPAVLLEYTDGSDLLTKLRPGLDGMILRLGPSRSTFLPQVWQQLPHAEDFLSQLCRKAGLHESAWRDMHPEIWTYQVVCFSEEAA